MKEELRRLRKLPSILIIFFKGEERRKRDKVEKNLLSCLTRLGREIL